MIEKLDIISLPAYGTGVTYTSSPMQPILSPNRERERELKINEIIEAVNKLEKPPETIMYMEEKPKRWKPVEGVRYWFINKHSADYYFCHNDEEDNELYESYNCFKTEEEAQQALELVKETLKNFHEANNG